MKCGSPRGQLRRWTALADLWWDAPLGAVNEAGRQTLNFRRLPRAFGLQASRNRKLNYLAAQAKSNCR